MGFGCLREIGHQSYSDLGWTMDKIKLLGTLYLFGLMLL